ncbi:hypothetical protein ACIREO_23185 [Streptomyces sp. NPDC102441]|uniref:hypothetical protein n=1 Tax=Streptomyces sp. NPDC102441 TaxID=3366176 RepID=UPI00382CF1F1
MADQHPHSDRVAPFARGGERKSCHEVEPSQFLDVVLDAGESCERALLNCQTTAAGWTPVLFETPGFAGTPLEEKDSLPVLPLPGPMYPGTR